MRRDLWPNHAGLIDWAVRRQTGTIVGVYRGADAHLDTADGTEPWSTVCEPHGGVVAHPTRALAIAHASRPGDWCPSCQESPRCPHDNLVLMWREDTWVCDGPIGCGDEWSTDVFPVPSLDSGLH